MGAALQLTDSSMQDDGHAASSRLMKERLSFVIAKIAAAPAQLAAVGHPRQPNSGGLG